MSVKFDKKKQLLARLKAVPVLARVEIRKALEKSAGEMVSAAQLFVPIKSRDLLRSIRFTLGKYTPANANVRGVSSGGGGLQDPDLSVTIHAGDEKAFYAAFVEFGVVDSPAQPYFYPAYRLTKKRAKARVSRAVKAAAQKAARA